MNLPSPPFDPYEDSTENELAGDWLATLIPVVGIIPAISSGVMMVASRVWYENDPYDLDNKHWNTFLLGVMAQAVYAALFFVYMVVKLG